VSCYNVEMKIVITIIALALTIFASEWTLEKEKNGIKVYTREVAGSEYLEFKGETVVEGSVPALVSILYDTPNAPAWLHECSFAMTLDEMAFEENYIFQIYDLPFPVSNRQVILHSQLFWTEKGARLETKEVNSYCDEHTAKRCETVQKADLIEIDRSRGHYLFNALGNGQTKIVWQQHIEPGGSIPTWLANALVVDIPYNSLLKLNSLVKDEKYREMSRVTLHEMWLQQYKEHH